MDAFQAYHKWLGIPPDEQPPNHYRLLGLKEFESDAEVIESAADRQMAHERTFQTGPNADLSQRILNELAKARRCLLNPDSRTAYDTVLRSAAVADSAPAGQLGAPQIPAQDELVGQSLGPYKLLERTGGGQFGQTYKAQHQESGQLFSLKVLPRKSAAHTEVAKRFQREIDITTKLDHPNLIVGVDSGQQDGLKYLVTEYVIGTDLATVVKQQGPLPIEQARQYIISAARGLTQLHLHGVCHRNLKPHVLLVDLQGNVKVTNLFLARIQEGSEMASEEELTRMGHTMGTYDYLPPEQAADAHSADARSDVYSLGCTLHFLLTGQPPFPVKSVMEKMVAHQQGPIPSLAAVRADVPKDLDDAFRKMLAKDPNGRFDCGARSATEEDLVEQVVIEDSAGVICRRCCGWLKTKPRWPLGFGWSIWSHSRFNRRE